MVRPRSLATLACLLLTGAVAPPAHAALVWVDSTGDAVGTPADCTRTDADSDARRAGDPDCTLRGALTYATANPGANFIDFAHSVCGPIAVASALPPVPGDTQLNGSSPSDASAGTSPTCSRFWLELVGQGGRPDGGASFPGLVLQGSGDTVFGFAVHGFTDGIQLAGAGRHVVFGNHVGAGADDPAVGDPPNVGDGVHVTHGAGDVLGRTPDGRLDDFDVENDLYGNGGWGLELDPGTGPTTIAGALIGTDDHGRDVSYAGGPSLGNGLGGIRDAAGGSVIGGTAACLAGQAGCNANTIANNAGPGIALEAGTSGTSVLGNRIGTAPDGADPLPNAGAGVVADGSGQHVGSAAAGAANVISGNAGAGVVLHGTGSSVDHDLIGTDASGLVGLGNGGPGVLADGPSPGANKVSSSTIAGNAGAGVQLEQGGDSVSSSDIGVGSDGRTPLANAVGLLVRRGPAQIGGVGPNTIARNAGPGVSVTGGLPGVTPAGVRVDANLITSNDGLPIDLGGDGPTPNDPLDADGGPNGLINTPTLMRASASGSQARIHGVVDAAPNTTYQLQLWRSDGCPAPDRPNLSSLLGGRPVSTDSGGHKAFTYDTGAGSFEAGGTVTATLQGPDGSTSESSGCLTAVGGADLSVTQAVTDGAAVVAGQPVDLSVAVHDAGPERASDVTLSDTLPADAQLVSPPRGCSTLDGGFACSLEDLAPGETVTLHVLVRPTAPTTLASGVSVAADEADPTPDDDHSDFATAVAPAAGAGGGAGGTDDEPAPTYGRFLRVDPAGGKVLVTLPNGQRITLSDYALIPDGTQIDVTHGTARITASLPDGTGIATADFYGGAFAVRQLESEAGLVDARLDRRLACGKAAARSRRRAHAAAATVTGAKKRHLWGHAHGRFRISGGTASATVRGTIWEVADTCTTSTVRVQEGVVEVDAVGKAKPARTTVVAGHSVTVRRH